MKVYDTDTAIELIYQNRHTELDMFVWDCVDHYNNHASEMGVPNLPEQVEHNTDFWLPDYYKELDVEQYIRQLCPDNHIARARVDAELADVYCQESHRYSEITYTYSNNTQKE